MTERAGARPFKVFLIAGEESGDQLGARLMEALAERHGGPVAFVGVGGERMARLGLASLFPMEEISYTGITAIVANLHRLLRRMRSTARDVVAAEPDVLVIIDCPGFNLGVARRVRRWRPAIPIVDYVSPTVWVWRPARARRMSRFVDHLLAILPFEPEAHRRLGGPPCTYVGHPLIERIAQFRPSAGERPEVGAGIPTLLVLPGSRHGEVRRLMAPFGEAVARVTASLGPVEVLLPAVARLAPEIRARAADWKVKPTVVVGEADKLAAFRRAHAALAASGTVTLELALSGVPMVVAYRVDPLVKPFKYALKRINSFVLPNLITGGNAVPEFLDEASAPERLAGALAPLFTDGTARRRQLEAFARLEDIMAVAGVPSRLAADIVIDVARRSRRNGAEDQRRLDRGT